MQRILVGVDGLPYSLHALGWAGDTAKNGSLDLVITHVSETRVTRAGAGTSSAKSHYEPLEELRGWSACLPARCQPHLDLTEGDAADQLINAVDRWDADLLVVGGHGGSGFAHIHPGSVAHNLVHHAVRPLAIVPPTAALTLRRLVIAFDYRLGSTGVVEFAADFAHRLHLPVTCVYSFDPCVHAEPEAGRGRWHDQAQAQARGWATPVEKAGAPLDIYVDSDRDTDPAASIEHVLQTQPGSAAIVAAHGRPHFGSLSDRTPLQLVHSAGATVIIVPQSTAEGG